MMHVRGPTCDRGLSSLHHHGGCGVPPLDSRGPFRVKAALSGSHACKDVRRRQDLAVREGSLQCNHALRRTRRHGTGPANEAPRASGAGQGSGASATNSSPLGGAAQSGVDSAGAEASRAGLRKGALDEVAAGAKAATEVEEREATQLLRAAERALGLLQNAGPGQTQQTGESQAGAWGQWGKLGKWGRWGWPAKEQEEADKAGAGTPESDELLSSDEEAGEWSEATRAKLSQAIAAGQVQSAQDLLQLIAADVPEQSEPVLSGAFVLWLLETALSTRNVALARSIVEACRDGRTVSVSVSTSSRSSSTSSGGDKQPGALLQWPSTDMIEVYCVYVPGLASLLRVSEAVAAVQDIQRRGLPIGDEVPFGHVVDCPTCQRPLAVVQPQFGRQVVPCSDCRYRFELVSGDLITCDSESLLEGPSAFERALRLLRIKRGSLPTAVHSAVMKLPDGTSEIRTFATSTPSVPAQQGERLTLVCAAPSDSSRSGPLAALRLRGVARAPGWRASEPMQLDNHATGAVLPLLRAPPPSQRGGLVAPSWLLPGALLLTASSTAGAALLDPSLPSLIATAAIGSAAAGTAITTLVLPQMSRLPAQSVAAMSVRQQLLKQYSALEERLLDLTQAAADEVRMLARMCQLQNKMEAVGEPSTYGARLERVMGARQGLQQRLQARLQLIDSYAKISAMIEIEVEMESDVPTAEAAGAAASIADQIERLMEVESLQQEWQVQAEANDDVERLLRSAPPLPEA